MQHALPDSSSLWPYQVPVHPLQVFQESTKTLYCDNIHKGVLGSRQLLSETQWRVFKSESASRIAQFTVV